MATTNEQQLRDALATRRQTKQNLQLAQQVLTQARERHREACAEVEQLLGDILGGITQERIPGLEAEPTAASNKVPARVRRPKYEGATAL